MRFNDAPFISLSAVLSGGGGPMTMAFGRPDVGIWRAAVYRHHSRHLRRGQQNWLPPPPAHCIIGRRPARVPPSPQFFEAPKASTNWKKPNSMRLCSSLESPQQSPTTTTSSISSTTSSASLRMSRESGGCGGGGLLHYNQRPQQFLTSNTAGGIGRSRPKPASLFFVPLTTKTPTDNGQSIDKTSPRRSNRRHNGGLLPAIVCPRSPGSKNVNGNAAGSKTFAKIGKAAAAFELGVDGGGHRLPQIRLKNALSASAAVSKTSIALVASSEIRTVRREGGDHQQQKQRHGEPGTKDVGKRRREKAEVTVRVRRRIIISDGSEDAVPSSVDHVRGTVAAMPTNTVTERRLNGTTAKSELVMKESIGTQTLVDEDEVNTNGTSTASAKATQTDAHALLLAHGATSAGSSGLSLISQEETLSLLAVIEDALDETIDRQSRIRTNEFIASTARKQAQIWRDAKEFVTLHLFPQAVELANSRTSGQFRRDTASELEQTLRNIQLP
uniref:Uncharacterized protein n=1 Tax=Globodera rostochiensis TaxID=31243 RepID=A0A914GWF7_GLORO